jgi:hypothetical protein
MSRIEDRKQEEVEMQRWRVRAYMKCKRMKIPPASRDPAADA